MGAAVMDTDDRTVIASVPFDAQELGGPPEDRTNPTADAQILESTTMDALPTVAAVAQPSQALVAVPSGMAALAATSRKPLLPANLWPQIRAHANQVRTLRTWQMALIVAAAVAFGAWLNS